MGKGEAGGGLGAVVGMHGLHWVAVARKRGRHVGDTCVQNFWAIFVTLTFQGWNPKGSSLESVPGTTQNIMTSAKWSGEKRDPETKAGLEVEDPGIQAPRGDSGECTACWGQDL